MSYLNNFVTLPVDVVSFQCKTSSPSVQSQQILQILEHPNNPSKGRNHTQKKSIEKRKHLLHHVPALPLPPKGRNCQLSSLNGSSTRYWLYYWKQKHNTHMLQSLQQLFWIDTSCLISHRISNKFSAQKQNKKKQYIHSSIVPVGDNRCSTVVVQEGQDTCCGIVSYNTKRSLKRSSETRHTFLLPKIE